MKSQPLNLPTPVTCLYCSAGKQSITTDYLGHPILQCRGCNRCYCAVERRSWQGNAKTIPEYQQPVNHASASSQPEYVPV